MIEEFEELYNPKPIADDEDFQYKLVGITVHNGTADAGHYWSYINTQRGDKATTDTEKDQWMEFEDRQVHHWDYNNHVAQRCYGTKKSRTG